MASSVDISSLTNLQELQCLVGAAQSNRRRPELGNTTTQGVTKGDGMYLYQHARPRAKMRGYTCMPSFPIYFDKVEFTTTPGW